jgi:hypothetical protein
MQPLATGKINRYFLLHIFPLFLSETIGGVSAAARAMGSQERA